MDINATIIAALAGAASAALVAWLNSRANVRKAEAEADLTDIAAIRGIAEAARDYAIELQKRVTELEAALDIERTLRRRLERKCDALIAWVRSVAPEADVNGFLAQLEAGQGG